MDGAKSAAASAAVAYAGWAGARSGGVRQRMGRHCMMPRGARYGTCRKFEQALPNYAALVQGRDPFLNLIDPRGALFMPAGIMTVLDFAAVQWEAGREPN